MKNLLLIAAAALGVGACSTAPWYPPPGMSESEARIKHYECQRDGTNLIGQSTSNLLVAIDQVRDCLTAHGFRQGGR